MSFFPRPPTGRGPLAIPGKGAAKGPDVLTGTGSNAPVPAEQTESFLLCIDLQPIFISAIADGGHVRQRCAFALEAAKGLGLPVLFTEQVPDKLGGTTEDLLQLVEQPEVMGKDAFSAFGNEQIAARVRASGAKQLLIIGLETPVCVFQTARDARQAGFQVTILADCVGARRGDDATVALAYLAAYGCAVLPAETYFYARLQNARHPFFRDFTSLVKKYG